MSTWAQAPAAVHWASVLDLLRDAERVLLLAHVAPDADAVGSALAVGIALARSGKSVVVSFGDDPFELPGNLGFLPGQELLAKAASVAGDFDLALSFDVSSASRLGKLEPIARRTTLVAVDHHRSYTGFGDLHLVDVSAPATAVLALELIDRLGLPLDVDVATCLYAGLLTDTGSFRYAAVTPDTHHIAARLLAAGIDHVAIARKLYDDQSLGAIRVQAAAVGRANHEPEALAGGGVAWTTVNREHRTGLPIDILEGVIDMLRMARDVEVAIVFKQEDTGRWRVSTRSRGAVDVGALCESFGGGGHRYAGGFESFDEPAALLARLLAALETAPA